MNLAVEISIEFRTADFHPKIFSAEISADPDPAI